MTSAAFIAISVLGGAALISGRNSRVKECHPDAQKHWNAVMSSCLGREGQRRRPIASLVLSMKRSGMKEGWRVVEEVVLLGGRGSWLQDWGEASHCVECGQTLITSAD